MAQREQHSHKEARKPKKDKPKVNAAAPAHVVSQTIKEAATKGADEHRKK